MRLLVAGLALASAVALMSCGDTTGSGPAGAQCDSQPADLVIASNVPRLTSVSAAAQKDRYVVYFSDAVQAESAASSNSRTQALSAPDPQAVVDEGARRVRRHGGRILRAFARTRAVAAELDADSAQQLRSDPAVRKVEKDPKRFLLAQDLPWGMSQIGAPEAWNSVPSIARGAKVCIVDSGVYTGHEDLGLQGGAASGYPAEGWNQDHCGHGTHVAGTIAALDNALGVIGASPRGADLFSVRVFGDDCSWSFASDLADAVTRCADAGARVINMSLGGYEPSELERDAFTAAWRRGVLMVAAAGNEGDGALEYPASYPTVISVGAVGPDRKLADFSQRNPQVDLVAPGVDIVSTVPFVSTHQLTVDGASYPGTPIQGAGDTPEQGVTGALIDGGSCNSVGAFAGRVVLCKRGGATFADKVANVQKGGAVAAVIYNDSGGVFSGTLGDSGSTLPAFGISDADGQKLLAVVGHSATVVSLADRVGSGYASLSGTSMAAPHVSGIAAFLMGQEPSATNVQVRQALESTALDLGSPGIDDAYGHGLVQAKPALDALKANLSSSGAPFVGFITTCDGLRCSFVDSSVDGAGGEIVRRTFKADDGATSTDVKFNHTFAAPGVHHVTLSVESGSGQSASISLPVSVISLSATAGRPDDKGARDVSLQWEGVATHRVLVLRNDKPLDPVDNGGEAVDHLPATRSPVTYRVCSNGAESCSDEVTVLPVCGQP